MLILKRWLPAILMALLIFVSSSLPGASISGNGDVDYSAHKIAHLLLYLFLTLAFYRATKNVAYTVILTIIYGISDELHQMSVPTRSGNIIDASVDTFAAVFTGLVLWKYYHHLPEKLRTWLEE